MNIPSKMSRPSNSLLWVTKNIRKMIKKRDKLHKKATRSQSPADWENFRDARRTFKKSSRKQSLTTSGILLMI